MKTSELLNWGWQVVELAKIAGLSRAAMYTRDREIPLQFDYSEVSRFIESSLLGDGSLVRNGGKTRFAMSSKNKEYLEWLRKELESRGLLCGKISRFVWSKDKSGFKDDCVIYNLYTRFCKGLNSLRDRWYRNGKEVPMDFIFTKEDIIRLYAEDGTKEGSCQVIYWGVKDDVSYMKLVECAKLNYEVVSSDKLHYSGGRILRLKGVEALKGYEYKA